MGHSIQCQHCLNRCILSMVSTGSFFTVRLLWVCQTQKYVWVCEFTDMTVKLMKLMCNVLLLSEFFPVNKFVRKTKKKNESNGCVFNKVKNSKKSTLISQYDITNLFLYRYTNPVGLFRIAIGCAIFVAAFMKRCTVETTRRLILSALDVVVSDQPIRMRT